MEKPITPPHPAPDANRAVAERKPSAQAGWKDLFSGTNATRAIALAGGVALHAVNVYIATTMLPTVVSDIGGLELYAWNTTLFVVASILGAALSIKVLGLAGPKGSYGMAAIIFAIGAAMCAVAPNMPLMLVGRFVQGIGGGLLFALAYAMIRIAFDESLWPRAMALVSGMWGVATLIGPAVGGVFAELGVWRAAFWTVAVAAVLFALLASAVLPSRKNTQTTSGKSFIPIKQLVLLTLAVVAISAGGTSAELSHNITGIGTALILAVLFVRIERNSQNKLLPTEAFLIRSRLAALYALMSLLVLMVTSGEVYVPLFLQVLHHQTPLVAGYLAALIAAGWTLGSLASAGATGRAIHRAILAGPLFGLAGMTALAVLMPNSGTGTGLELAPICLALTAIGLGVGLTWPHLLTSVLKAVPPEEQELAGASITTIQLLATATGAALAGLVTNAGGLIEPGGIEGTIQAARCLFSVFAVMPLLAFIAARRCRS
ncbi:MFS transporter [Ectopseudomonas alcaliphila]|uniref:MFS transporter n=1 Tax=Ectopseudomonas alcaliphila TaxID=101564 RepID=UPI002783C1A6|nr:MULTISPECIES: MFS transporter [Pseudomonas]MDP9939709.1 MFS family permease [Pseudomonas sp. 3400]MDR7012724.1 MFS family permease [Pseudomonas alcaliphila]